MQTLFREQNHARPQVVDRILFAIGMVASPVEATVSILAGAANAFSISLRAITFVLCVVGMALSLWSKWGKANSSRLVMIELFLMIIQLSYSCFLNNFLFDYALLVYSLIPIAALFMVSPRWIMAFLLTSSSSVLLAIWTAEAPVEDPWRLSVLLCYSLAGAFAAFSINNRIGKQLIASNERFRVLAEFSSDIIAMHDIRGAISYVSPSSYKQAGYHEQELLGVSAFQIIHPADREMAMETYQKIMTPPHEAVQLEYRLMRKDGSPMWVEAVGTPVLNKQGRITHVVTTTRDISKRKRAENDRAIYNAQLLRINRELDEFAFVVSHDLKAPLRGIATLTDFIEEDLSVVEIPDGVKRHFMLVRNRIHRLDRLINDILDYSRAGRSSAAEEDIDMEVFLRELVALQGLPSAFKVNFEGEFPTLTGSRIFLEQVFGNLINNAHQHHDQAEGTITVMGTRAKGGWEISISDNGPGIAPQHHERIFEIFHQLSNASSENGTGIGLAVVRKVVNTLGGKVRVSNCKPRGACFTVFWPVKDSVPKPKG